jgi:YVTN family beta-propeller protein
MRTTDSLGAGSEFAGYRLEECIGYGGMGVVYRARDEALDRSIAVKLISPALAADRDLRNRFLVEARMAASLDHPNVVPVYDAGEINGQLYLAMRYVQGTDLRALLADAGLLEHERALAICAQIAKALDVAHERGLVHRDVKPSNVLLDEREHAYLADFGLTKRLSDDAPGFDASLSIGTPAYVAPEQIEGGPVDGRADQYSLACLLYECLTGKAPFRRPTVTATLYAHLEEEPPGHPGLERVFATALAKDPDGRYASCGDFVRAARNALGLEVGRPVWSRASFVVPSVAALLVGVGIATFALATSGGAEPTVSSPTGDGRVTRIDPQSDEAPSSLSFGHDLSDVALGAGSVWVASFGTGTLARIDPRTGAIDDVIAASAAEIGPTGITVARNRVWIVSTDGVRPYLADERRFANPNDLAGDFRLHSVHPVFDEVPIVADGQYVWTLGDGDMVVRHAIAGGTVTVATLGTQAGAALGLALGEQAIWSATNFPTPQLVKLDRETHRVVGRMRFPATEISSSLVERDGALWVASFVSDEVLRVETRLAGNSTLSHFEEPRVVARIPVGRGPTDIAAGAGSVWVANYLDGTISRIDPATNSVVDTIAVGAWPEHIAAGQGGVWVTHDSPRDEETT